MFEYKPKKKKYVLGESVGFFLFLFFCWPMMCQAMLDCALFNVGRKESVLQQGYDQQAAEISQSGRNGLLRLQLQTTSRETEP